MSIMGVRDEERAVGDINSTARGSGARFNGGKPAFELVPARVLADFYTFASGGEGESDVAGFARDALYSLACWQETGSAAYLHRAIAEMGAPWEECCAVFDYGRRKYAEWNWAKGMKWSVPFACAVRHLRKVIEGEPLDAESGEHHFGHVLCNIVMLLTYQRTYQEGDDRPRCFEAKLSAHRAIPVPE